MHWKTEPAGLFITRDRLAANAAFSPRTRSGNTERAYMPTIQTIYLCAFVFPRLSIAVLSGGLRTPDFGEGEAVGGRRWYRSKKR